MAFSKRKYSSLYKPPPPNISAPKKIFRKGSLTKNKPRGLLSEFYGMYRGWPYGNRMRLVFYHSF